MSQFLYKGHRRCSTPLPIYRKTLDQCFDFEVEAPDVKLRLRIFTPLWKNRHTPMVLLCWTVREPFDLELVCQNGIVSGLRQEIVSLMRRVSLVERFVRCEEGKKPSERIHKVLSLPSQNRRRTENHNSADNEGVLLPLRRSLLEALIGEPLDGQEGENDA